MEIVNLLLTRKPAVRGRTVAEAKMADGTG
jgi:hypothetical protein